MTLQIQDSIMILQITSFMVFLFSIKVKMYQNNVVGFITVFTIFISFVFAYFVKEFEILHYLMITFLLLFIAFYHTYKLWKRNFANV